MKLVKILAFLIVCGVAADLFIYEYRFSRAATGYLSDVVDRLDYEIERLI